MQTASAFNSVQNSLSFFINVYRTLAEWRAVIQRLDGFDAGGRRRRSAAAHTPPVIEVAAGDGHAAVELDDVDGEPADRHAAGRRRRHRGVARRPRAGHRPVRRRQVDAVPRHRRHLAVRLRPHRGADGRAADDAAAAAVFPGRHAGRGGHLSGRARHASSREQLAEALQRGRPAGAGRSGSTRRRTGTACCRSASSSGSASRAPSCRRRTILFLDEATASLDEPSEAALYRLLQERLPAHHHRVDRPPLDARRRSIAGG